MSISHDDIEPELSNAQEAFRHGGQTPEEGLDVSSTDVDRDLQIVRIWEKDC